MMKKTLFELWNLKKKCLNKCRERERERICFTVLKNHTKVVILKYPLIKVGLTKQKLQKSHQGIYNCR